MKTKGYILSLDQKRDGTEVLVFDMDGQVRSWASFHSARHGPGTGRIEEDAEALCATAMRAMAHALKAESILPREVRTIGITSESDTMVLWERDSGLPVGRSIKQLGDESVPRGDDLLSRRIQKMTVEATGLSIEPSCFAGFKLCWMLNALPGLRERAGHGELSCGTLDSWLIHRLTGGREHITDLSNALRTRLYDIRTGAWNRQLLELLEIPASIMPRVRPLSEGYGETDQSAFFGIPGIPLAGIGQHQKTVLFG